jgi:uncharacterized protein YdeI (YjbR/CyaY-like superfamily)
MHNERWDEALALLSAILCKAPLEKAIKWGAEVFTYEGKNVVSYGGFKNYFAIWFYNGVFLKDPYKVLINAQEGRTRSLRQWRFTAKEEIDEKKILEYVREAIAIEQKGWKVKPEKFSPLAPSQLLADALKEDKQLQLAFGKLTPGKQKEYIIYINEAKQEATKVKRLEKIKPIILEGRGLNDQYK